MTSFQFIVVHLIYHNIKNTNIYMNDEMQMATDLIVELSKWNTCSHLVTGFNTSCSVSHQGVYLLPAALCAGFGGQWGSWRLGAVWLSSFRFLRKLLELLEFFLSKSLLLIFLLLLLSPFWSLLIFLSPLARRKAAVWVESSFLWLKAEKHHIFFMR